ncbi:MAG: iron chelate uptake ABC transporter family permease subunit, partial [Leptospiraceae bacterium]|nr:iron chelate uptake ABC transporter family permease subunit [Leptospiraceae bacterium]
MIIDLQHRSWLLIFIFLSIFLYLAAVIWGSVYISPSEILNILLGKSTDISNTGIIFKVRIPEATTAAFAGAGLSVAGLLMQTLFRNPLAGPSILGISSGASLGVAFFLLYMGGSIQNLSKGFLTLNRGVPLVFFATAGAIGISLVLLAFSSIVKDNVVLLIIGILISNLTLSLVSIWQSFSNPEAIQDYLMWTFGSLGSCRELSLFILCAIIIFGLFLSFLIFKPLNSLLLGEDYSASLGVNIAFLRIGIL